MLLVSLVIPGWKTIEELIAEETKKMVFKSFNDFCATEKCLIPRCQGVEWPLLCVRNHDLHKFLNPF